MVPSPTPKRDHDLQSFGLEAQIKRDVVRAEGLEPSLSLRKNGFSCPATAFAALGYRAQGLGSGLSLHQPDFVRLRCCPSSLYTFLAVFGPGLARDRHVTGFPEFEQFYAAGFPAGTQVFA